jgi:glucuronoxylan 4-O-methyltransferase
MARRPPINPVEAARRLVAANKGEQATVEQYLAVYDEMRWSRTALVFGVGRDARLWLASGARVTFVEDDEAWAERAREKIPGIDIRIVKYWTKVRNWEKEINMGDKLRIEGMDDLMSKSWDTVFVDAPGGWNPDQPGRLQSIYCASVMKARSVFVHDAKRALERNAFNKFLGTWTEMIDRTLLLKRNRPPRYCILYGGLDWSDWKQ